MSTVTNVWLAEKLEMGISSGVSRYVTQLRHGEIERRQNYIELLKSWVDSFFVPLNKYGTK